MDEQTVREWRRSYGMPESTEDLMAAALADQARYDIKAQATGAFGYNPVAKVTCPHCGGIMEAIDALKHVA